MRRRARVDENQPEIVEALRKMGATVQHLSAVGQGCPDLLVGYEGLNLLMEIKWPLGTPSQRELTPAQKVWHKKWRGHVAVVTSAAEAVRFLIDEVQSS